jgi:DNA adenine methylase
MHPVIARTLPSQPTLIALPRPDFATRKQAFLKRLKSPGGKLDYKRYLGSPLRYAGGKSLAVGMVLELIPDTTKRLVSPFFGGGSVEIACAKELGMEVIGYDIFDVLVNYWQCQVNDPHGLYHALQPYSPTRETFTQVKDLLKLHCIATDFQFSAKPKQDIRARKLEGLELAAAYYFNHNTSYGPHFLGWPSSVYLQKDRYLKMIGKVRDFKAPSLDVRCGNFKDILPLHKNDFLYCDPPYYLEGDSKTFIGLYPHRNFPIHHNGFDHAALRDLLMAHKGGFILSYNDCSTIREWYQDIPGIQMSTPSWQYTFSQGDTRIGSNRLKNNNGEYVKRSHELLIWRI